MWYITTTVLTVDLEIMSLNKMLSSYLQIGKKYQKPHIYDKPYAELDCGSLDIEEIELDKLLYDEEDMWWLNNKCYESIDPDEEDEEEYKRQMEIDRGILLDVCYEGGDK